MNKQETCDGCIHLNHKFLDPWREWCCYCLWWRKVRLAKGCKYKNYMADRLTSGQKDVSANG